LPAVTTIDGYEAHKMARILERLRRPYGREYWELIRSGKEGSYWQAADGLIVRLCVAEAAHEADVVARHLLELAVQYASGR
jgi:hypothetical protein